MDKQSLTKTGYLFLISVIIGWGTSWPFLKISLSEIPPWTFRGLIAPTAAILVFSAGFLVRQNMRIPKGRWRQLLLVSLFNIFLWHIFSAWGIKLLGSGQASIIAYTMPLWAVLCSILINREKPHFQRLIGLGLGLIGLSTLSLGELGVFSAAPTGTIMMLTAAIFWGIGTAIHKTVKWEMPTIALVGWQLLIGGLPITIVAVFLEAELWPSTIQNISLMAILSTLLVLAYPIIFCWFAWFHIVSEVPISVSTVSIMLVPVIGVFSGQIILEEIVGLKEVLALIFVCGALAFALLPAPKRDTNTKSKN